ncbi:MAG: S41 family peptidase [Ignavibacteriaceae bacterium]|nr:S41 family peptidase [Ignavibacteriaceae bacterium]
MLKKRILIPVLLVSFFVTGFVVVTKDLFFEISKNIDIFTRVYKEITFNYVDEINPEQFLRAGIKGMLNTLDPYTVFIDEKRKDDIDYITNGKYGGVGISIGVRDNSVTILELMDGYSAQRQGIKVGDIIHKVEETLISKENYDDVSYLVKGEPGTAVSMTVIRASSDTLIFKLVREEIVVKNIPYFGFYPENSNNAYIKLNGFTRTAGDEFRKALIELRKQKQVNSIILDLRGNPGGLLDVAVDVTNKFIKKGELIVSTKGRDSSSLKQYFASQEPMFPDNKLIVLVNEGSASASEIVAGAVQDHDRGIILGAKTFGKGLVQTITPLSYNTSLKITTAKYFTPSGRCIQKIDYSLKNSSISKYDTVISNSFKTDNKRSVFSSGGITPDSLVEESEYSDITRDLMAKGFIFKFINELQNNNPDALYSDYKPNTLYDDFRKFLSANNYIYKSNNNKKIDELRKSIVKDKKYGSVIDKLSSLEKELQVIDSEMIDDKKDEISIFLKIELASRFFGSEGRIKVSLDDDKQLQSALNLLQNEVAFNKILNKL